MDAAAAAASPTSKRCAGRISLPVPLGLYATERVTPWHSCRRNQDRAGDGREQGHRARDVPAAGVQGRQGRPDGEERGEGFGSGRARQVRPRRRRGLLPPARRHRPLQRRPARGFRQGSVR